MSDVTLAEFLLARITEDEAVARAAVEDDGGETGGMEDSFELLTGEADWFGKPVRPQYGGPIARLITRTAVPARVLAECEAKRRIVEAVSGWQHETVEDCWYSCAATYGTEVEDACCNDGAGTECDCGLDYRKAQILEPLALPYADHPDYRDEWRP